MIYKLIRINCFRNLKNFKSFFFIPRTNFSYSNSEQFSKTKYQFSEIRKPQCGWTWNQLIRNSGFDYKSCFYKSSICKIKDHVMITSMIRQFLPLNSVQHWQERKWKIVMGVIFHHTYVTFNPALFLPLSPLGWNTFLVIEFQVIWLTLIRYGFCLWIQ